MNDLTRAEIATMWIFGKEYSQQALGIRDYYARMGESRRNRIADFLAELDAASDAALSAPPTGAPRDGA